MEKQELILSKQRTFWNCAFPLWALQCVAVQKQCTRWASNFACNVHIDTRWCTQSFKILGLFPDTERDYFWDAPCIKLLMSVYLFICLFICLNAFFSAISKPTGMPFGTKLPLGPGMVLKQQYLGKRKKCGNAARNTSFLAVLVKYLGHFETDLDAFWHEITFWSCEGCKTSFFGKTQKMWQRCTENVILNGFR